MNRPYLLPISPVHLYRCQRRTDVDSRILVRPSMTISRTDLVDYHTQPYHRLQAADDAAAAL